MPLVISQQADRVWNGPALARLNQQTGALLKQIQENPGVSGAFVCDNRGALLAAQFATTPERSALEQAGRWLAHFLAIAELRGGKAKEMEFRYADAGLLVRNLGNAFEAVLCQPSVNWSLLRMALNVSASRFEQDTALQQSLYAIAPTRFDTNLEPAQRWIWRLGMSGGVEVRSQASMNGSNPIDSMVRFAGLFVQELANHGFDLDNLLETLEQSLQRQSAKYPLLRSARIAGRTIDLSALQLVPADFGNLIAGWGELIWELHSSSVIKLGRNPAETIFRRVCEAIREQDAHAFRRMAFELALRDVRMGGEAG